MNYIYHLGTMVIIYAILASSLNLLVGYSGLVSLSHAAFYGLGAYIASLLVIRISWMSHLGADLIAVIGTALIAGAVSWLSLRFKGDYFVLASLGFQSIVFIILYNWCDVTNCSYGLQGITRPEVPVINLDRTSSYFFVAAGVGSVCLLLIYFVCKSPFGQVLKAIREDSIAAESLGKKTIAFKVKASMLAAAFAAVAGVMFAEYARYIDPRTFGLGESIFILSMVIIGGAGNFKGPIFGAVLLIVLPEMLRFVGIPDSIAASLRQIIYGFLLIILMRLRPQGIFGEYRFN